MSDIKIQPLGKRVLIKPEQVEAITSGGLVLPPDANDDKRPAMGTVVTLGVGKKNGENLKFDIKIGDKVYFKKYSPEEIEIGNEKFLLLDVEDILAIIK